MVNKKHKYCGLNKQVSISNVSNIFKDTLFISTTMFYHLTVLFALKNEPIIYLF